MDRNLRLTPFILIISIISSITEINQARACSGSTYGPRHLELLNNGARHYGHSDGVIFRIFVYDGEDDGPATLNDILNERFSLTLSPLFGDRNRVITGELVEPEVESLPGTFIWRPSEGLLELGDYQVTDCEGCYPDTRVSIVNSFESAELAVELRELSLSEKEKEKKECCQKADCDLSGEVPCGASEWRQYCRICWVAGYDYPKLLKLKASRSQTTAFDELLSFQVITNVGDELIEASLLENFEMTIPSESDLPEQICAQMIVTDLVTAQRREGEELCIPSSMLMSLERREPVHTTQELNEWHSCEEGLTPYQRSRINQRSDSGSDGSSLNGCTQGLGHRSFWWVLSVFLCSLLLKRNTTRQSPLS